MTGSERIAAHRARLKESGYRSVTVLLPPDAIASLDKLTKESSQTKADVIAELLSAKPAAKAKATKKVRGGVCTWCGQWKPDAELDPDSLGKKSQPDEIRYLTANCKDQRQCGKNRGIIK